MGPTETTVWSTLQRIETAQSPIHLGEPVDNTFILVIDDDRRIVSRGNLGEICIGGEGLARGYLNRPDLMPAIHSSGYQSGFGAGLSDGGSRPFQ